MYRRNHEKSSMSRYHKEWKSERTGSEIGGEKSWWRWHKPHEVLFRRIPSSVIVRWKMAKDCLTVQKAMRIHTPLETFFQPGHLCSVLWIQRQKPWQGSSILWHMHQLLRCCENIMHPKDEETRYNVNQIKPSSRLGGSNSITDNLLYGTIRLSIIEFSVNTLTSIWLSKYELISSSSWFWQICFLCLDWLELKLTSVFCRY